MDRLNTVKRFSLPGLAALNVAVLLTAGATSPIAARATAAEFKPAPFSKYQTILDRMPFGALPPNFGEAPAAPAQTDAQVQAEQKKLAQQINMSCINVTPDGSTAIGFTDLSAKPPVNFYLVVGATGGGWTVVDANFDEEWAQIEKEGVTITLKLGKGLIDAPPARAANTAVAGDAAAPAPAAVTTAPITGPTSPDQAAIQRPGFVKRPSYGNRPSVNIASLNRSREEMAQVREDLDKIKKEGGDVGSYMERLRERKAQEQQEKAAAEEAARVKLQELAKKITQDELSKREREMNLNLLMQGAKPISDIELTPEEEAALVEKGVLAQ